VIETGGFLGSAILIFPDDPLRVYLTDFSEFNAASRGTGAKDERITA